MDEPHSLPKIQHCLADREGLSIGSSTLHASKPCQTPEGLVLEPVVARLGFEVLGQQLALPRQVMFLERNIVGGPVRPEVSVPLGDLVLEDQVICGTRWGRSRRRCDGPDAHPGETERAPRPRLKSDAASRRIDFTSSQRAGRWPSGNSWVSISTEALGKKGDGRSARASAARCRVRRQHHDPDGQIGHIFIEPEQRAPGPDLDVVRVRARWPGRAAARRLVSGITPDPGAPLVDRHRVRRRGWESHFIHGRSPARYMDSSNARSFSVSAGCQNPLWRNALTRPEGSRRDSVSPTKSSPGRRWSKIPVRKTK